MEMNYQLTSYITQYENVFPEKSMEVFNQWVAKFAEFEPARLIGIGDGKGPIDKNRRNVDVSALDLSGNMTKTHWVNFMTAGVHKVCKLYAQDKKILHQNLLYQIETVQLLRYKPGGFYIPHVDQGPYANRALSYIYFVNDEFEGGGLNFFLGNDKEEPYHINPKKNSAVVFPSNFVFTHEVCPISSGERYTLVTWIL